jgi:hypothetical protein
MLLASKDEALPDASSSLNDWSYILANVDVQPSTGVFAFFSKAAKHWSLTWVPALPQSFPCDDVIQTWKIYAVLSYQEAHKCAREEVPGYFDDSEELDRQVKERVAEESRQRCKEAGQLLSGVEPSAVSSGRSRMLAQKLLRFQLEQVVNMQKQGVLKSSEAHHLDDAIHDALLKIAREDCRPGLTSR